MPKSQNILFLIFISFFILAGTFYDYQITLMLTGHFTVFARFFEIFGDLPVTVGLSTVMIFYTILNLKNTNFNYKILGVILSVLSVLMSSIVFIVTFRYFNPTGGHSSGPVSNPIIFLSIILGLLYSIILLLIFQKKTYYELKKYKNIVLFTLVTIATVLIGTNLIKVVWGRPRLWLISEGVSEFRPWYSLNPFASGNEYMSFISGHTANASLMILITQLPLSIINKNKNKFLVFGIMWGILTGISRIFSGQHYITDVAFAMLYVGIIYNIFVRKFGIEIT